MKSAYTFVFAALLVSALALAQEAPAKIPLDQAQVPGNLVPGGVETFDPGSLYKAINGHAVLYLAYGVRQLTLARFAPPGQDNDGFEAEVYEMGSTLDAFGIFSSSRSTRAQPVDVGTQGLIGTTQLAFYQGPFFAKVRAMKPVNQPEVLTAIAKAVSALLPPGDGPPPEPGLVRIEGVQENTIVYQTRPSMKLPPLQRGFEAEVKRGANTFTIANAFFDTPEAAEAALKDYETALADVPAEIAREETALGQVVAVREPPSVRGLFHLAGTHLMMVAGPEATLEAGLGILQELVERQNNPGKPAASRSGQEEPLTLVLPKPQFTGTPRDIRSANLESLDKMAEAQVMVPPGLDNLALGKPVSASVFTPLAGDLAQVTDGDKEALEGSYIELPKGVQYVQVDLGAMCEIYAVVVWHYHLHAKVYRDVMVQISEDPDFILDPITVFNNDHDGSAGFSIGTDKEYIETYRGKAIEVDGVRGRYVRLYSNGNTSDEFNQYIEIEVYGRPAEAEASK